MDAMQNKREALLTTVMNLFSETFREKAILHGGMVLRLLDCPRYTNDIDYLFVPFKSKNAVAPSIVSALNKIPGITVSHSLNSKCLRVLLKTQDHVTAQIEVKVDSACKTDVLSSTALAKVHHQSARIIAVMDFKGALANKMSAWLDRRLMRDLYDIHFLLNMGIRPDPEILMLRLKKPVYAKGVRPFPAKPPISISDFVDFLKEETLKVDDKTLSAELSDVLSETERAGLAMRIKASISSRLS